MKTPPHPTTHIPGSQVKVEVMAWRRAQGYHLYHPLDATIPEGDEPIPGDGPVEPVYPRPRRTVHLDANYSVYLDHLDRRIHDA